MDKESSPSTFDFFVLAPHGTGEIAIFRYLELHPQIFTVLEDAIQNLMTVPYISVVKEMFGTSIRTGWVYANMQRLQTDLGTASEIAPLVRGGHFIQLVRDPIRLLLALYNSTMKFYSEKESPAHSVEKFFALHVKTALFHRAGSHLAPNFQHWEVVDTSDISGTNTAGTLRRFFGLLNLSADETLFNHPALISPQNDLAQTTLRHFKMNVSVLNTKINFMVQSEGSLNARSTGTTPVTGPDERYEAAGGVLENLPPEIQAAFKTSTLKILVEMRDWMAIHPKVRALIVRENLLGKEIAPEILRRLSTALKGRSFQRLTVEDLDKKLIAKVKSEIAPDARALFLKEPSLRQKWDICGDV